MTGAIEPGWYPDPSGAAMQRYFDGYNWTPHCAPAQGQAIPLKGVDSSLLARLFTRHQSWALAPHTDQVGADPDASWGHRASHAIGSCGNHAQQSVHSVVARPAPGL